jgi:putative tryptophan/tyrosine transport system substrate-binding protein
VQRLSRRRFVVGLGAAGLGLVAGCTGLPGLTQHAKIPRVGYLAWEPSAPEHEAFRQGLRELGYVEGQNLALEYRWAEAGRSVPDLVAELVGLPVDVFVAAAGSSSALAAQQLSSTVPIIVTQISDPVGAGLVASLARPGGNITGLSVMGAQLTAKRLDLLREVIPHLSRVAYLYIPSPAGTLAEQEAQVAARTLSIDVGSVAVRDPNDVAAALEEAVRGRADALWADGSPLLISRRGEILNFAAWNRLPVLAQFREYVAGGGLMSYGPSRVASYRRAAYYVDRILKGAKPADLPFEQPMLFDFVINAKTARALGISFPPEIMLQVTEVIE